MKRDPQAACYEHAKTICRRWTEPTLRVTYWENASGESAWVWLSETGIWNRTDRTDIRKKLTTELKTLLGERPTGFWVDHAERELINAIALKLEHERKASTL